MKQLVQPNIEIVEEAGYCLQYARRVFGAPAVEETAHVAWNNAKHKHHDRNFPQGVSFPVWFDWTGDIGYGRHKYDHVAVYHTDGKVWSSPLTGRGRAWFESVDDLVRAFGGGMKYKGWSEDISGVKVIGEDDIMDARMTDNVWLGLFGEHIPKDKQNYWVGKKMDDMITTERASAKWKARNSAAKGLMDSDGQVDAVFLNSFGRHVKDDELKKYKGKNWHATLDDIRKTAAFKVHHDSAKAVASEFEEVKETLYRRK